MVERELPKLEVAGSRPVVRFLSARAVIAVLAVLAVIAMLGFGLLNKGSSGIGVGDPVPTASMPKLEGDGQGSLADYRGRWVLVNFWASWCEPCKEEAPALQRLQDEHGDPDFTVLGIGTRDLSSDGRAFVRRYGLTFPQLRDGDGDVADEYGTTGVPETFLVDPRGRVRQVRIGPATEEYLSEEVVPLLPGGAS